MAGQSSTPISADRVTTTEENAVLTHPMLDQLTQLGLSGMAQAFVELEASNETAALTHADWLRLPVDRELTHRRDKRLAARLRYARLRQQASVEDVDYRPPRGLDRALFHKLTNGEWIDAHDNLIWCGRTGVGKSWLLVPWVTRPAATTARFSISGFPSSSPSSRSPAVTAAMPASCAVSPAFSSSSSTIGASNRSTPAPVVTSARSSRNAMGAARPFSPAKSPSTTGMPLLATQRTPTPSLTGSFTMPTASISPARASDADAPPDRAQRIDDQPPTLPKI